METRLVTGTYGVACAFGQNYYPSHTLLATNKVRLVGDLVALVVAESRHIAEDACDLIEVEYDDLPPVITSADALDPQSSLIFEELGTNVLVRPEEHTYGDVEGAFARCDRVLTATIRQHRHQSVPMECRGVVVRFDQTTGGFEVWSSNQGVHQIASVMSARLGVSQEMVHVRTADVGGSFGLKIGAMREDVACAVAARDLGRPVKWIEDRSEHLIASGHAREETVDVEVAITHDGDILGLKAAMVIDTGAYPGIGGMLGPLVEGSILGPYRIPALSFQTCAAITNKASYVAYRGPWAIETFVRERLIDLIACELRQEPLAIRLRNVVRDGDGFSHMATGASLAGVTACNSLEMISRTVDLVQFRERQADARRNGRYLGVGMATFIEAAPGPRRDGKPLGAEHMTMELLDDGRVAIYTGQMPHGQGHETTLAQVAADELGVPIADIRVVVGDTHRVPPGFTGGSKAATMAGGAARMTARSLRARILSVAAHVFEADPDDLFIAEGVVAVRGVPTTGLRLEQLVEGAKAPGALPGGVAPDFAVAEVYDGGEGGWSGGSHCAIVEVDIATGRVRVERYVVAEDCGELINPAIVDGQIRGGVAQGIGAVLFERSAYDEAGQYLSSTFLDYLLPSAVDIPRIEIHHLATVPLDAHVNFRGVGEGGMIVAPATICNAIEDALSGFGVKVLEQHLPPNRILELAGLLDAG